VQRLTVCKISTVYVLFYNYQTKIWKTANIPISEVRKPWEGHGWKDNGEPLWCHDDMILPVSLVDILAGDSEELDDSDDDDNN